MTMTTSGELMGLGISPLMFESPEGMEREYKITHLRFMNYNLLNISTNLNILN